MRTTRALAASAVSAAAVAALGLTAPAALGRDGMGVSPSNIVVLPAVIPRGGPSPRTTSSTADTPGPGCRSLKGLRRRATCAMAWSGSRSASATPP